MFYIDLHDYFMFLTDLTRLSIGFPGCSGELAQGYPTGGAGEAPSRPLARLYHFSVLY